MLFAGPLAGLEPFSAMIAPGRVTGAGGKARMAKRWGGIAWWVLGALVLALTAGGGMRVLDPAEVVAGRARRGPRGVRRRAITRSASSRLSRLAKRWTSDGEVYLLLGESELERGRNEPPERRAEAQAAAAAALAAWSKVPRSSPYYGRACLLRATHLINTGHYTPAEETLLVALGEPARRSSLRARARAQPALSLPGPFRRGSRDRSRRAGRARPRRRAT